MASFTDITHTILDLGETPMKSTSVEHVEFYEYAATQPNARQNVELLVRNQDQWTLPCESWMEIVGHLTKTDGTDYESNDEVALENTLIGLFESLRLVANGQEVEALNQDSDVAAQILGLVWYSDDFAKTGASGRWWYKDTSDKADSQHYTAVATEDEPPVVEINENVNYNQGFAARHAITSGSNGFFSAKIPLSALFGFCRDVRKAMFGVKWQLFAQRRATDDEVIHRKQAVEPGKVTLSKFSLWMPTVTLSTEAAVQAQEWMMAKNSLTAYWQAGQIDSLSQQTTSSLTWKINSVSGTERPRHVFIAFQKSSRRDTQEECRLVFDNLDLREISLTHGTQRYPLSSLDLNYAEGRYSRAYGWLLDFKGRDQDVDTGLQVSAREFASLYPIYHFNLEHQPEGLNDSVKELTVRVTLGQTVPDGYTVYAFIMSDRVMSLHSDGQKLNFLYGSIN